MAVISRPGKEGNATTYQGKVAAGYSNILAQEVDADIDAIYAAWNGGTDTVNIKDGAVTPAKLAPGAVTGSALAPGSVGNAALAANSVNSANIIDGTIQGADIAPGAITDALVTSVAWTKLIAPLLGTLPLTPRANVAATASFVELEANLPGQPGYDNTKPSYLVRCDYTGDNFEVWRAPATTGTPVWTRVFYVTGAGRTVCNLADLSVARNQLAVNSCLNVNMAGLGCPANWTLSTPNVWTNYGQLPQLTTRGGLVFLSATPNLAMSGPAGGAYFAQRWVRQITAIFGQTQFIASTQYVPVPGLQWVDNPPAGNVVYTYQVLVQPNVFALSGSGGDGGFIAVEVG